MRALPPAVTVLASGLLTACTDPTLPPPGPRAFHLVEKGRYQSIYGPDGRLQRILHDENGDGTADAVLVYGADGILQRAELDTDKDAVIDRWEYFAGGKLVKVSDRAEPIP